MSDLGFGNVNTTLSGNNGGDDEKQKTKKTFKGHLKQ